MFPSRRTSVGSDLLCDPIGPPRGHAATDSWRGPRPAPPLPGGSWRSPRRVVLSRPLAANASDGPESGTAAGGRACPPSAGCQHDEHKPVHDRPIKSRRTSLTGDGRHTSEQQQQVRRPSPDEPWTSQDHFRSGPSVFAKRGSRAAVNDHGVRRQQPLAQGVPGQRIHLARDLDAIRYLDGRGSQPAPPAERRKELLDKRNGDAGHIDTRAIRCRALRALMPAGWWLGPPTAGATGTGARGARPGLVQPPTAQEEDACERS